MEIILHRTKVDENITEGYISIKNKPICDTVENTLYCIARGKYRIELEDCRQYKDICIVTSSLFRNCTNCMRHRIGSLHANLPCYCPMIKRGNGAYNRTDGSIIVGKQYLKGVVLESQKAYKHLFSRIRRAIHRDEEVTLVVE